MLFAIPVAQALSQVMFVAVCGYPRSSMVWRAEVTSFPTRKRAAYSASPTEEQTVGMIQLIVSIIPLTEPSLFLPKYINPAPRERPNVSPWYEASLCFS